MVFNMILVLAVSMLPAAEGYVEPTNCHQPTTYPFITEKQSRMFIKVHRGRRSVDCTGKAGVNIDCLNDETSCECNIKSCSKESDRELYCDSHERQCGTGQSCYLSTPCPKHWETACTYDACLSYPCKHGTCTDGDGTYTCTCEAGYEGIDCEIETNECESNPCLNGATCHDHLNSYTCTCAEDFTGTNCEIDMCRPQFPSGADVVFLLDASRSQNNTWFEKQRQYVNDFIYNFPIGPADFQIALVIVSRNATVEFYLNSYTDASLMISHVNSVQTENGPSFTGKGLQKIREEVFEANNGARQDVYKYVIVLSDGLSSDVTDTVLQAGLLNLMGVNIMSVATGNNINQKELIDIASLWNRVFPSSNRDAVNAILKTHVMDECPDCYHSTTDVAIMIDHSSDISFVNHDKHISALNMFLKAIPIEADSVHVSCFKFSQDVENVFNFDQYFSASDMTIKMNGIQQSSSPANVTNAIKYLRRVGFQSTAGARTNTRKLALLVTSGDFENENQTELMTEVEKLKNDGVILASISIGRTVDITSLLEMVSDPMYVYVLVEELNIDYKVLYSLIGSLDFDVCDMD